MKRCYGIWCEYSHHGTDGKYTINYANYLTRGYSVQLCLDTARRYESLSELLCDLVSSMKVNGYYIKWYRQFDARWYEIWLKNAIETGGDSWKRYGIQEGYVQLWNSEHSDKIPKAGEYK